MKTQQPRIGATRQSDEEQVRALYQALLQAWNERNAEEMAGCFAADGGLVGFDGTPIESREQIAAHLRPIFASHPTAAYVGKVRELRFLGSDVALLRAVAGMVPPGQRDINPSVNTVQTMVAERDGTEWRIVMYQNTPAAFHGRPEAVEALTEELRALL